VKTYRVIGLMSGTSLDGLDIAYCEIRLVRSEWQYKIGAAETILYNSSLLRVLREAGKLEAADLALLHSSYGAWMGKEVLAFIHAHHLKPNLIASHGHTVYHQPQNGYTVQIGSGADLAAVTGFTTVCDFRSSDVARGGQGAPLVPVGDELLFPKYDYCLNLGGFSNISYRKRDLRLAFDICPVNIVLNHLSRKLNKPFDKDGLLARSGKLNVTLLRKLDNLDYYQLKGPKSLGKEWVDHIIFPLLDKSTLPVEDLLHTFTVHAGNKISSSIKQPGSSLLITGGGVYNQFLMEKIRKHCKARIVVPDDLLIQFKEALVFALLGVLRMEEKINCLRSVTGAREDSIGGCIYR